MWGIACKNAAVPHFLLYFLKKQLFSCSIAIIINTSFFEKRGDKVMKKVVKFGGSSLASAEQFIKVGKIILADESRCYVVPSAPGA